VTSSNGHEHARGYGVAAGKRGDAGEAAEEETEAEAAVAAAVAAAEAADAEAEKAVAARETALTSREAAVEVAEAEARDLVLTLRSLVREEGQSAEKAQSLRGVDELGREAAEGEVQRLVSENDGLRRQVLQSARQASAAGRAVAALAGAVVEAGPGGLSMVWERFGVNDLVGTVWWERFRGNGLVGHVIGCDSSLETRLQSVADDAASNDTPQALHGGERCLTLHSLPDAVCHAQAHPAEATLAIPAAVRGGGSGSGSGGGPEDGTAAACVAAGKITGGGGRGGAFSRGAFRHARRRRGRAL